MDAEGNLYAATGEADQAAQTGQPEEAPETNGEGRPEASPGGVQIPSTPPSNPTPPTLPQPNPGEPKPIPKSSATPSNPKTSFNMKTGGGISAGDEPSRSVTLQMVSSSLPQNRGTHTVLADAPSPPDSDEPAAPAPPASPEKPDEPKKNSASKQKGIDAGPAENVGNAVAVGTREMQFIASTRTALSPKFFASL